MNKYQRLAIVAALINILIVVLFPPFSNTPLPKAALPSFDGFFPIFAHIGDHPIHQELLNLELMFIGANALAVWLALQSRKHHTDIPDFAFLPAIGWFALINFAIIFAFPPFEHYQSMLLSNVGNFDNFYFIVGNRSARPIFWPLLYLECMLVIINALSFVLLFTATKRGDEKTRERLIQLTEEMPDEAVDKTAENIGRKTTQNKTEKQSASANATGRGGDRRQTTHALSGSERRTRSDRRA